MGYAGSTNSKIGEWVNVSKSYNYEWNIPGEQQYVIEGFEKNMIKLLSQLDSSIRRETKILHKDRRRALLPHPDQEVLASHAHPPKG